MTHIEIPDELPNILRDFTISVLHTKPPNIINYAVEYFTQLQQQQQRPEQLLANSNSVTTTSPPSFSSTSQHLHQQQEWRHNIVSSGL